MVKKGEGLSEQDQTKMQRWWYQPGSTTHVTGTPELELWVATKDFDTGKTGRLVAGLYDCPATPSNCTLLTTGGASFNQSAFGHDFGRVVITMGQVDTQLTSGRGLMLKIAVPGNSDDDLWIAYGTSTYPSAFTVS
ncbi:MAG: hypothetical protein GY939_08590 [Actinomycetia bacterium]|nr:hypothetical protein [Actinomycetes bacterium]